MVKEIGHFIGGKHVKGTSGRFADVFNPNTGEVQARVALASQAELRAAVENAPIGMALYNVARGGIDDALLPVGGWREGRRGHPDGRDPIGWHPRAERHLHRDADDHRAAGHDLGYLPAAGLCR